MRIYYPEGTPDHKKLMRCTVDRQLVTKSNLNDHAGHTVKIVNYITFWEWLLLKLGVLR